MLVHCESHNSLIAFVFKAFSFLFFSGKQHNLHSSDPLQRCHPSSREIHCGAETGACVYECVHVCVQIQCITQTCAYVYFYECMCVCKWCLLFYVYVCVCVCACVSVRADTVMPKQLRVCVREYSCNAPKSLNRCLCLREYKRLNVSITVADPRGARDVHPPLDPKYSILMLFSANNCEIIG